MRLPLLDPSSCGCAASALARPAAALARLLAVVGSVGAPNGELGARPGCVLEVRFACGGDARFFLCAGKASPFSWTVPREGRIAAPPPPSAVGDAPNRPPGGRWPALPRPPQVGDPRIRVSYPRATYLPPRGKRAPPTSRGLRDAGSCVHARWPERCFVRDRIPTRTQHPSPASTRRKNRASTAHQSRTLRHPQTPAGPRPQARAHPARRSRPYGTHHHEKPRQRSRRTRGSRGSAAAGRGEA